MKSQEERLEDILFDEEENEAAATIKKPVDLSRCEKNIQIAAVQDMKELDHYLVQLCSKFLNRADPMNSSEGSIDRSQVLHDAYKQVTAILQAKMHAVAVYLELLNQPMSRSVRQKWCSLMKHYIFWTPIATLSNKVR